LGWYASLIATGALVLVLAVACGSGADTGLEDRAAFEFQRIDPSAQVFTFDDLAATGFRTQREYNVEGLAAATGAWFGWWQSGGGDPIDYEVRFYGSHEDAVEYGTSFAEEASGKEAILNSNDATWKEDVRDRRSMVGVEDGGASGAGPKYADYAILGNVVMLCQGLDAAQSLQRCESLARALVSVAGE